MDSPEEDEEFCRRVRRIMMPWLTFDEAKDIIRHADRVQALKSGASAPKEPDPVVKGD